MSNVNQKELLIFVLSLVMNDFVYLQVDQQFHVHQHLSQRYISRLCFDSSSDPTRRCSKSCMRLETPSIDEKICNESLDHIFSQNIMKSTSPMLSEHRMTKRSDFRCFFVLTSENQRAKIPTKVFLDQRKLSSWCLRFFCNFCVYYIVILSQCCISRRFFIVKGISKSLIVISAIFAIHVEVVYTRRPLRQNTPNTN